MTWPAGCNGFLGDQFGDEYDYMWQGTELARDYEPRYEQQQSPPPKYVFHSLEELVKSEVFQHQLSMALAFKDKQIMELRNELLNQR